LALALYTIYVGVGHIDAMDSNMNKLPVFFISHGAPNIILQKDSVLTEWHDQVKDLEGVERILIISAHWETEQFSVGGNKQQRTIHDFYGFPDALYEMSYSPPADEAWATQLADTLVTDKLKIITDHKRGLDHGSWVPLTVMFPQADIPVSQISVSKGQDAEAHYKLGQRLAKLREQGVLIITSGVIVHNLQKLDWLNSQAEPEPWASSFIGEVHDAIISKDSKKLFYPKQLIGGDIAVPTAEHYLPLLVALGASEEEHATIFADVWRYGNLSQHSYRFEWNK
jgi:4,5-DOPA dioxygenase extradiol